LEPNAGENGNSSTSKKRRMEMIRPVVPWLQKTKYMTGTETETPKLKIVGVETKFVLIQLLYTHFSSPIAKLQDKKDNNREEQIKAIEETFEFAQNPPVHPTRPDLKAEQILPVFPNEESWPNKYHSTNVILLFAVIFALYLIEILHPRRRNLLSKSKNI
jgi:hypothetical protein